MCNPISPKYQRIASIIPYGLTQLNHNNFTFVQKHWVLVGTCFRWDNPKERQVSDNSAVSGNGGWYLRRRTNVFPPTMSPTLHVWTKVYAIPISPVRTPSRFWSCTRQRVQGRSSESIPVYQSPVSLSRFIFRPSRHSITLIAARLLTSLSRTPSFHEKYK